MKRNSHALNLHAITIAMGLVLVATMAVTPARAEEALTADEVKFFESKIRPVLIKECYGCHSTKAGNVRGGLRLDTRELTHIGGSSGPAVVPGEPDLSLLYTAMTHEDFVMPPKRKLSDEVIADFRKWIEMGAPDPRQTKVAEIKSTISEEDIQHAKETFWAYKKPEKNKAPQVENETWVQSDIDRHILANLEQSGLAPSEDATAYKVLRRLCFDLVGLPPSPEQIKYFESKWDEDPQEAIAFVVDQLLQKEQFGERWGRHWLDVARYGESTGREVNMTYPHAWRYRDYVIDSFNEDKPFDQFVQEQIAGDLLPVKSDQQWAKNLVATSFLAMGPKNVNEQNAVQFAADVVDEQIDATTRVFLGTSVACARCHDHKFDAIPQTDYYALAGIFASTETFFGNPPSEYGNFSGVQARRTSSLILLPVEDPNPFDKRYSSNELQELKDSMRDQMDQLAQLRRNRNAGSDTGNARTAQQQRLRAANQLATISAKLSVVDNDGNPRSYCMGVQDRESVRDIPLLARGEIDQRGPVIKRGFPQALCDHSPTIGTSSSGRLELARWIGSDDNPLTARVMVNRIWQHMIGQGLVTSTENFGVTGQAPSHPELLDYLAVRFVESGWSVKSIVREIATSHIYRVSSEFDQRSFEYDPDNALVWRANPRRLDAEAIRDAMLSVSGEIELDRPRGSEVAKAGYVRVRDGALRDPREMARELASKMAGGSSMRGRMQAGGRPGGGQFGGGQFGGGQFGGRGNFRGGNQQGGRGQQQAQSPQRNRFAGGEGRPGMGRQSQGRPGMGRQNMAGQNMGRPGQRPSGFDFQAIAERVQNQLDMQDAKFRSVYLPIVRDELPRSMEVFDFADASTVTGTREASNTANQALYMMNNPFVLQQSEAFADRIVENNERMSDQIRAAFVLAYGRPPTSGERAATASFFKSFAPTTTTQLRSRGKETLIALCQSLFASAEFRYID